MKPPGGELRRYQSLRVGVQDAVSTSQSVEDEPTLTQVDDLGDSQATLVGDDTDIVDTSSPLASRTVDGAGVVIAFNSNRSDEDGEEVRKDHNHADPLV